MKSSAAVLRWNRDFSSLGTEESASLPSENSTFPKWRIAATTLNIASCKTCQVACVFEKKRSQVAGKKSVPLLVAY